MCSFLISDLVILENVKWTCALNLYYQILAENGVCSKKSFVCPRSFLPKLQVSQLLINSHKLKHEVSGKKFFILYIYIKCVFYDVINFYLYTHVQKSIISLILLKNVKSSVPEVLRFFPNFQQIKSARALPTPTPMHLKKR